MSTAEIMKEIDFVNKTTLDNGLKIVTEHVDSVKSVAVGIWAKTGSRNETHKMAGVTHFLEHMLFKGTENRSSQDIAMSMESVGGYLNAFTSSEYTCYYSRCLNTQLERALDVLSDMVLHPSFPEGEIEKEKKVVIEEMKMYRDSPNDYLFEQFSEQVFKGHPLGNSTLGFEDTVSAFERQDLYDYMDDRYQPSNLLISVAGNVDHGKVVKLISEYFREVDPQETVDQNPSLPDYEVSDIELTKQIIIKEILGKILNLVGLHRINLLLQLIKGNKAIKIDFTLSQARHAIAHAFYREHQLSFELGLRFSQLFLRDGILL